MEYDVFISHAHEDKESVARPLAAALEAVGARVWIDELRLTWGESLSSAIDRGLARSRYGIVVLSPSFFKKAWTQRELQGLVQRQVGEGRTVVLPLYCGITNGEVRTISPTLADAFALEWDMGPDRIAERFKGMLGDVGPSDGGPVATVGGASMTERAKALIQGGQQIAFEDLVRRETEAAIAEMRGPSFDLNLRVGDDQAVFDEFKRRLGAYEAAVEDLTAALSAVAYYGGAEYHVAVRRALERLGDEPNDLGKNSSGGVPLWVEMRRYPAILAFHRTACAAVAAERWGSLQPLLRLAKVSREPLGEVRVPMLLRVRPCDLVRSHFAQWLVSDGPAPRSQRLTPAEDYLAERIAPSLAWFGVDSFEAERVLDAWLMLAQIAYLGIPQESGRYDLYFSAGRSWRVLSTFGGWERSPQAELVERVRAEGDASPVLLSGVAPDATTFLAKAEQAKEMILRHSGS